VHIHLRDQRPDKGHLPCWDPKVAADVVAAIRDRVPKIIVNMTTGTFGNTGVYGGGEKGPTGGPISCLASTRPEMAALNSGSLNYLKVRVLYHTIVMIVTVA
jgi:3-keto-5-aminohexanoate cleavage enzyme